MMPASVRLSSAEAAARLGVRVASLYAYVSRGEISRIREGRRSWFDPVEIERLAQARRRAPHPGAVPGTPLMVLDTDLVLIEDGYLYFRGRDAVELAREGSFEHVARWVRSGAGDPAAAPVPDRAIDAARRAADALGSGAAPLARLRAGVLGAAACEPRCDAPTPASARLLGAWLPWICAELAAPLSGAPHSAGIAAALVAGWGGADPQLTRVVDAALTLSIDHDLAVSALAARVAASARAGAATCVSAALAAFDAPLHGRVSAAVAPMLRAVMAGEHPERVLGEATSEHGVPGFGHRLYAGQDPRSAAIRAMLDDVPAAAAACAAARHLADAARSRVGSFPNIDLALATLSVAGGFPDDAGVTIFVTGRTIGWTEHVAAEYAEQPMRLRPHGRYIGT